MKIKSYPESYSKLLIDYIRIAREFYYVNILIKVVDDEKKWLETFEASNHRWSLYHAACK